MLYLIGLGLYDEKDMTVRGIETAKQCHCFIELYTSKWSGSLRRLEGVIGHRIEVLKRRDMEEGMERLLKMAAERDVAIFVPGDPLVATTHSDFLLEARKRGIGAEVIHNASIFSAIAECGLQIYKFGRTATIPFSGQLEAVKNCIEQNRKSGLHTLLLLDLDSEVGVYMSIADAIRQLLKARLIKERGRLVAVGNLGYKYPEITYKSAKELQKTRISTPSVLVMPGKLHFREKEFLESL